MKTKFLFSAAIVSAMFAACTNDELVQAPKADLDNSGRVMVGKVKLDFGNAADTRMTYDSETDKFKWDGTETIGALLVDTYNTNVRPFGDPDGWNALTWTEKYKLIDYIHTDYPFTWSNEENAWVSNAKMLEGNYFFAYPYEGYSGQRQLVHSLANQKQYGGTKEAMEAGAAKNQYWIGYSQIKAGIENKDVLATVKMARVLAPISFAIKVIGSQKYTIEKVTIQGDDLKTMLTLDPTDAAYTGKQGTKQYNLEDGTGNATNEFNYANFIDAKEDLYDHTGSVDDVKNIVYNIEEGNEDNYYYADALRETVDAFASQGADKEYAELYMENVPAIGSTDEPIYGMIFVNSDAVRNLKMSIYTKEGIIKEIDLTKVNTEIDKASGKTTVITDKAIEKLTPTTRNFINIQIDDNSIDRTDEMIVNNVDDLERFINWNVGKNRTFTATLANNDTLTQSMVAKLKAAQGANATPDNLLKVKAATNQKLTIAADVDADVLNFVDVEEVDIEVLGAVTVDDTKVVKLPETTKKITVAENATLTIEKATKNQLDIVNKGNIVVENVASQIKLKNEKKAEVTVNGTLSFVAGSANNGKIVVEGEMMAKNLTNNSEIENKNKVWNVTNESEGIVYTATGEGKVNHFEQNNGTIWLTGIEDAVTVEGTPGTDAIIKYVGGDVDMSKVITANVTELIVTGGWLHVNDGSTSALTKLEINGGTLIEGGDYVSNVWTAAAKKLDFAAGAEVILAGASDLTISQVNLDDATVAIKKGNVNLKGSVTFGGDITLGSTTGYTKNGVKMEILAGATVAFESVNVATEAVGAEFRISNNGTATKNGTIANGIDVVGKTIQ